MLIRQCSVCVRVIICQCPKTRREQRKISRPTLLFCRHYLDRKGEKNMEASKKNPFDIPLNRIRLALTKEITSNDINYSLRKVCEVHGP